MNRITSTTTLFLLTVFVGFFVFFYVIHPLYPIDPDDFQFLSDFRVALPQPYLWNPTRVLPEILSPLCGYIAAYVIYPLTGNYYDSFAVVNALVVSAFITIYANFFIELMKIKYRRTDVDAVILAFLFILLHFTALRVYPSGNQHLFYCGDVCCYYFYLIPNLIGACIVMSLMCNNWLKKNEFSYLQQGYILLVLYLILCSNILCSILLVAYIFSNFIIEWFNTGQPNVRNYCLENKYSVLIMLLWGGVHLIEYTGGRANDLAVLNAESSVLKSISEIIQTFVHADLNKVFVFTFIIFIVIGLYRSIRHRVINDLSAKMLIALSCVLFYYVVLCTKIGAHYIASGRCLFVIFFFVLMYMFEWINIVYEKHKRLSMVMPLMILLIWSFTNTTQSTFRDVCFTHFKKGKYDLQYLKSIREKNIQDIIEAVNENKDSVILRVPHYPESNNNWPFVTWRYNDLENMLHKHGMISKHIKGRIIIDENL